MSAENLLLLLDEADEFNVLFKEALTPGALGVVVLLVLASAIGWQTGSIVLGAVTLIASAWCALGAAWLVQTPVFAPVLSTVKTHSR